MKKLFEFTLDKEEEVVEEEIIHEKDGSTTTKAKKVKKFVPKKFFVRKPTHSMLDEGGLYYGVQLAKSVKAGMLTESMLRKRFEEDGGILTEGEEKAYSKLFEELRDLMAEEAKQEQQQAKTTKKETAAQKKKKEEATSKKDSVITEIQQFEMAKSSLFAQTAENRARTKTVLWWMVTLSYKEDEEPSFMWSGDTIEDQVENYADDTETNTDPFNELLRKKFMYYVSFWFGSRVNNENDFKKLAKQADAEIEKELKELES